MTQRSVPVVPLLRVNGERGIEQCGERGIEHSANQALSHLAVVLVSALRGVQSPEGEKTEISLL
jgi:hypothetical protein